MIAFLLNPLVRDLQRLRLPRGLAVALVFLLFATAVAFVVLALGSIVVDQTRSATTGSTTTSRSTDDGGKTGAEQDIDRLQHWLDTHRLERIQIQKQATDWADNLGAGEISKYTQDALSFAQGAAFSIVVTLFNLVLIVVIAIYMLLDMERLERLVDRRFPPGTGLPLTLRIEKALAGYVRGQLILSTVIGLSAGIGMWILGRTGLVPGRRQVRAPVRRLDGRDRGDPVHRARGSRPIPPAIYALVVDPVSVLWVLALFVFIYQVEGHIVVPNVMAQRAPPASAARHLRPARGRRALRHRRRPAGAADDGRRARDLGVLRRAGAVRLLGRRRLAAARDRPRGPRGSPADVPLPR